MQNEINKKYQLFFLFHFRILNLKKIKTKKDNMTQDIATVRNKKIKSIRRKEKKKKRKKEVK